ncbi:MAG: hypothetical protein KBT47_04125 [Armatimonadetes bacterium]|nr:hypothetical protein [Candidatus Hippobium faecium]
MILFLCLLLLLISSLCFAQNKCGNVEYRGAFWDINGHGNHRAVIKVSEASDYN